MLISPEDLIAGLEVQLLPNPRQFRANKHQVAVAAADEPDRRAAGRRPAARARRGGHLGDVIGLGGGSAVGALDVSRVEGGQLQVSRVVYVGKCFISQTELRLRKMVGG
jgi:hypothetical protein